MLWLRFRLENFPLFDVAAEKLGHRHFAKANMQVESQSWNLQSSVIQMSSRQEMLWDTLHSYWCSSSADKSTRCYLLVPASSHPTSIRFYCKEITCRRLVTFNLLTFSFLFSVFICFRPVRCIHTVPDPNSIINLFDTILRKPVRNEARLIEKTKIRLNI